MRSASSSTERRAWEGDALIGADGLWSTVRPLRAGGFAAAARHRPHGVAGAGRPVGFAAALRSTQVTVWLGPRLHAVAYPVRRGDALNVVVLAESAPAGDARDWDQSSSLAALQAATGRTSARAPGAAGGRARPGAPGPSTTGRRSPARRRWRANASPLVGDAAHPMLPYLAQGAGMAIEDAVALAEALDGGDAAAVPAALTRYAATRWQRNAQVQARARRNGEIFHATGLVRLGRDAALRLLGARLARRALALRRLSQRLKLCRWSTRLARPAGPR